jgi:hypothetical protein
MDHEESGSAPTPAQTTPPLTVTVTTGDDEGWEFTSAGDITGPAPGSDKDAAISDEPPARRAAPEASDDEGADEGDDDAAAAAEDEAPAPQAGKNRKGKPLPTRVAELRAEVDRLTAQKHALRRELAAPPPPAAPPPAPEAPEAPLPKWADYEAEGKSWDEYSDARDAALLARAERAATVKVRQQMAQDERQQRERVLDQQFDANLAKARAAHADDFETAVDGVSVVVIDTPQGQTLMNLVRLHPEGGEIFYQLGTRGALVEALATGPVHATNAVAAVLMDPDVDPVAFFDRLTPESLAKVGAMPPASALVALTKLAVQANGASGSPRPAPPISKAAPPIRPVGGGRTAAPSVDPDDLEFGPEYIAAQNAREQRDRAARYGVGA